MPAHLRHRTGTNLRSRQPGLRSRHERKKTIKPEATKEVDPNSVVGGVPGVPYFQA